MSSCGRGEVLRLNYELCLTAPARNRKATGQSCQEFDLSASASQKVRTSLLSWLGCCVDADNATRTPTPFCVEEILIIEAPLPRPDCIRRRCPSNRATFTGGASAALEADQEISPILSRSVSGDTSEHQPFVLRFGIVSYHSGCCRTVLPYCTYLDMVQAMRRRCLVSSPCPVSMVVM